MAINESQKVDWLWKKLGYGVAKTDVNSVKAATNESIASPLLIRGDIIWQDAAAIPTNKPAATTTVVGIYDDSGFGTATVETTQDATATPNRTWKTNQDDWISSEFGSTYQVKVYLDNTGAAAPQTTGTQLFAAGSGNNDEWFFDYQSGVLNFIGDNLPGGINGKKIYVVGARYIGNKGGNQTSANIANFTFNGNTIGVSNLNGDIILDPNGTGNLTVITDNMIIDGSGALVIPVGTTAQRPTPNAQGMIRYNTTDATFEGFDGANWGSLGGVKDVDGDTYIVAETGAGTDNDQLDFYTAGTQRFQIGATGDFKFGDTLTEVTIAGATGDTVIAGTLDAGNSTLASATVSDLTDNRIVIAGTAGLLEDDTNFTFDGTTFEVGTSFDVTTATGNTLIGGSLGAGETTLASATVSDLTNTRLVLAGTAGAIQDDVNLTFDGTELAVGVTNFTVQHATGNVYTAGNLVVTGDFTVNGTQTTVNSNTVTIDDPIFTLGGDTAPVTDDNKDRGIEFNWYDSTAVAARVGFFGFDDSNGKFTFIPDATNTNEVFSGTAGDVVFGQATLASTTVSDLTDNRIVIAGTAGLLEDDANFTFDGTELAVGVTNFTVQHDTGDTGITGTLDVTSTSTLGVLDAGETTLSSATISDLTTGRVVLAGTDGAIEDSANLTFDGTDLTASSAIVSDLTDNRIVIAGTAGALEDDTNFTFDGTTFEVGTSFDVTTATGAVNTGALEAGETTLSSATISDLTANRVVLAGTAGAIEDSANLTFDGTDLTASSAIVSDLTDNRIVIAGTAGAIEDDANFTFDGTELAVGVTNFTVQHATGDTVISGTLGVTGISTLGVLGAGETTLSSATVSDLTSGRVVLAGTDGAIEDSTNLTFDGTTLTVTGSVDVSVEATLASATVSDLTDTRIVLAGTNGSLEDDINFTFDGTELAVGVTNFTVQHATGNVYTAGDLQIAGNLQVDGTQTTVNSTTVTIDDPIFTLGGDTAPTLDDNKDRGIEFNYFDTTAKVGFFGFDDNTGHFTFIPDATNTGEVFSGTTGELDAKMRWANLLDVPSTALNDTTYNISAETNAGGTNLRLTDSNAVEDDVLFANGTNVTIARTDDSTITISSIDTITNAFNEFTVTDTDTGFTWTETGTALADATTGELTFVSGTDINVDVDATSDAIRFTNTSTLNSVTGRGSVTTNDISVNTLTSTIVTGDAPLVVASTTLVTNLNADLLDGQEGTYYLDWTNTTNKPDPVITLGGDLTGSVTLTDLTSGTLNATINANSVALGTDTTGAYVSSLVAGTGVTLTNNTGETATPTIAIGQEVETTSDVTFNSITGPLTGNADTASKWANPRTVTFATGDVTGSFSIDGSVDISDVVLTIGANSVELGTDTTGNYVATITGTTNEIEVTGSGSETAGVTIGLPNDVTIGNDLIVTGNLQVNGTQTTVNSTTVTIDDPIFTLGGDTVPTSDDNKDRGIEFNYFDTTAKVGFFGFDESESAFTFIPDATNTNEVFSGTAGDVVFGDGTFTGITTGKVTVGLTDDNTITTTAGNLTIDSFGGTTTVDDILEVTGALNVTGIASLDGGIDVDGVFTVANTTGDIVTTGTLDTGNATLDSATVSDLTDNRIVIAGTAGLLEDDANFTFDGTTLTVNADSNTTGAVNITGDLDVDNININGNTIISTDTDGNINITPDGTGEVVISTATVSDLVDNEIVIAGTGGLLESDSNFRFDGTDFMLGAVGAETFKVNVATGTTDISGNLVLGGNITIGDADTDDISFAGELTSNIVPNANDTYDLGATTKAWRDLYISESIQFTGATTENELVVPLNLDVALNVTDGVSNLLVVNSTTGVNRVEVLALKVGTAAGTTVVNGVLDEDTLVSDSNTALATQQSIKAYVDSQVSSVDLDFSDGTTAGVVDLGTQTFSVLGTANEITTTALDQTITIGLPTNITVDVTGNADTASALEAAVNIALAGDVVGTVSFDGSSDVSITTTIQANSVALGTDTTGNYVATIAGTANEIEVTGSGTETSAVTIGLPDDVTIGQDLIVTGSLDAGETTLSSATISDLTATRVVLAGTAGAIEDSANLTFNGSILAVTGAATISTTLGVTGIASLDGGIEVRNTADNGEAFTVAVGTGNTVIAGTVAANSTGDSLTVADTLRIAQTGSGLRMTNVGGFDNDGSNNFRVFGTNDLILAANGDSGTAITIDAANQNVEITNDLVVTGDLTVSGTTTYINTTTLNIGDNIITLNADITNLTAPTENAGIEVLRGTDTTKSFIWDETADNWTAGTDTIVAGTFEGSIDGGTF